MKPIADALRPPEPAAPAEDAPRLLDSVVAHSSAAADAPCPPAQVQGVALGRLGGIDANGGVLVSIEAWKLHDIPARSLVALDAAQRGQMVALGFEQGDPLKPLVLGLVVTPAPAASAAPMQARVVVQAEQEIELRCGEAAIVLNADGRIRLRGSYITSHASATQRILGGSVKLN